MSHKVLVLGADGYLGWPTCVSLADAGYEVLGVDNYLRRNMAREENVESLIQNPNLIERAAFWNEKGKGKPIQVKIGDLRDWTVIEEVFGGFRPDTIIHYAEQPSAPYSMMGRRQAMLTLANNIEVTGNVIFGMKEFCPDAHLVKLGTMGEYGTPNIDIEEGWLNVQHQGREQKFLYPRQAGSLYHTTKVMDTDLLWFYVRAWGIRVTDLMQGPVYGLYTNEIKEERLLPNFHYDHLFGTCLNRFIAQAIAGVPLTVYGKGGQTRGYLNLIDTLNCIKLSTEKPAGKGELRIFNQFTELFSVNELAEKVRRIGNELDLNVQVQNIPNPRKESEEHYYNVKSTGLKELGLKPNYLTDEVLRNMLKALMPYKDKIQKKAIFPTVAWS